MPGITYNLDIPLATNNPSVDQPNMKINTNAIDTILAVDHISFNTTNGGQHEQVTLPNTHVSDPSPTGVGSEIYTKTLLGVAQLFFANSAGTSQLTGLAELPSGSGYITLQGGIVIQWGSGNGSQGGIGKSFPITFPNNCFTLVMTRVGGTPRSCSYANLTTSGFTAFVDTSGSSPFTFIAIGN